MSRDCVTDTASFDVKEMGCISCKSDDDECGTEDIVCYCDEDNCNNGNRNVPFIAVLLIVAMMKFALM